MAANRSDVDGLQPPAEGRAAATQTPAISCDDIRVTLTGADGAVDILSGINLEVKRKEFIAIIGASGSGKTTLLRVLGGLQEYSGGEIRYDGERVQGRPPGVVTVFQDYTNSLLPWRTVYNNVALGIESKLSKRECAERVEAALKMVSLEDRGRAYPWQLSGGMQQRVQIARALATRASVLLMDEPFGALDALTRSSLQDQLQEVQAQTHATVVFVTHDVDEAVYLSDRVLVLAGRPAAIALELPVDLPRPRDQVRTKESPVYLAARRAALDALGHGAVNA